MIEKDSEDLLSAEPLECVVMGPSDHDDLWYNLSDRRIRRGSSKSRGCKKGEA